MCPICRRDVNELYKDKVKVKDEKEAPEEIYMMYAEDVRRIYNRIQNTFRELEVDEEDDQVSENIEVRRSVISMFEESKSNRDVHPLPPARINSQIIDTSNIRYTSILDEIELANNPRRVVGSMDSDGVEFDIPDSIHLDDQDRYEFNQNHTSINAVRRSIQDNEDV